jgi:cytochrome P450
MQNRLQQEIDTVLQGRLPTLEDLSKLEFLNSVIKETLRVYSPAVFAARLLPTNKPSTFTLKNEEELTLEPGTAVVFPVHLIHSSEEYYIDPKTFDPDRWSPQRRDEIKPLSWLPFGYGARICPAERLATAEMKLILILIMQNFDVELTMPAEMIEKAERLVFMAKDDIPMKFKLRH